MKKVQSLYQFNKTLHLAHSPSILFHPFYLPLAMVATSTTDTSPSPPSRLVSSASAVSSDVRQFTPVSIAVRRIANPSLTLSPCVGVSTTRSIWCSSSRSISVGASSLIRFTGKASTPFSFRALAVFLVAKMS